MLISLLGIMTVLGKIVLWLLGERAFSICSPSSYMFLLGLGRVGENRLNIS
jgi:hypothetical protein